MVNQLVTSESFYILLLLVIVNVFTCLFFLHRYLDQKRTNKRLNAQLNIKPDHTIKQFLDNQFDKTRTKKFDKNSDLTHDLANLRMAYLRIESGAIKLEINSDDYWTYVQDNLKKLYKIIARHGNNTTTTKDAIIERIESVKEKISTLPRKSGDQNAKAATTKTLKSLNEFSERIKNVTLSSAQLKKYQDKIDGIIKNYESQESRNKHLTQKSRDNHTTNKRKTLDKLTNFCKDNSATINYVKNLKTQPKSQRLADKIAEYERDNDRLSRYVQTLKLKLTSDSERKTDAFLRSDNSQHNELTDEIISLNEQEISRLKDVIKSQRNTILELEELTLRQDQLEADELSQYTSEIEQLKRSAIDSEMCIKILEDELDSLKGSLKASRESSPEVSAHELENLNQEINQLKEEISKIELANQQYESLLQFIFDAFTATSVEDISLLLHESISAADFSPLILIKAHDRTLEIFDEEKLSTKNKVIINNMQLNEVNQQGKGQLIFRLENLSGMLIPAKHNDNPQDAHEHVTQILKLANTIIKQILNTQKGADEFKRIGTSINDIQQASYDVDTLMDDYIKQIKSTVTESFNHMKSSARAKGLTATQIASIQAAEQDVIGQLKAQEIVRPKIRKRLLDIIKQFETNK